MLQWQKDYSSTWSCPIKQGMTTRQCNCVYYKPSNNHYPLRTTPIPKPTTRRTTTWRPKTFKTTKTTTTNQEKSSDANRLLTEVLISKLQERLKLLSDEDDIGLYDRGLYDGYLNALKIVTDECEKHFL